MMNSLSFMFEGCYHCGLVALFVSFVILVIVGALASIPLLVYGKSKLVHVWITKLVLACKTLCWFSICASYVCMFVGIRGLLDLEECAIGALHSLDAFNLLTGLLFLLVFVAVVIFTSAFIYELCYGGKRKPTHHLITSLLILAMYFCVCDIAYSFYIANQVYGQYDEFQQGQVNCSSPVYYSSFVSVVIVHLYVIVEIGLGFLLYWWWTLPTGK